MVPFIHNDTKRKKGKKEKRRKQLREKKKERKKEHQLIGKRWLLRDFLNVANRGRGLFTVFMWYLVQTVMECSMYVASMLEFILSCKSLPLFHLSLSSSAKLVPCIFGLLPLPADQYRRRYRQSKVSILLARVISEVQGVVMELFCV